MTDDWRGSPPSYAYTEMTCAPRRAFGPLALLLLSCSLTAGCACDRLREPARRLASAARVYVVATRSDDLDPKVKELGERLVATAAELEEATK